MISIRSFDFRSLLPAALFTAVITLCATESPAQMRGAGRFGRGFQPTPDQFDDTPQAPAPPKVDGLGPWLKRLHELTPVSAEEYDKFDDKALSDAARAVGQWVAQWGRVAAGQPTDEQLAIVGRLLDAKDFVDRQLDDVLFQRVGFAALPAGDARHTALKNYLQAASTLVDLSGRLRYSLIDILEDTAGRFYDRPEVRERLISLLAERASSVGAEDMSAELFDPTPAEQRASRPEPNRASPPKQNVTTSPRMQRRMAMARMMQQPNPVATPEIDPTTPLSTAQKLKLIDLIAQSGNINLIDDLAELLFNDNTPPTLVLAAAEAIRTLGLPQDPRPGQDDSLRKPAATAAKLRERLQKIDVAQWTGDERKRVEKLSEWLAARAEHGLEGETYRIGSFEVRPGDWLLMRNPSPYNLFTDLSPGLFTHVGVVALENGSDGKRRMVIVDLPEIGSSMPATNVEVFLDRTLNYMFLRHPDPAVARKMGASAAATIGNPTQFDLNFRTDRIAALKGVPLAGQKIHTYCAGLLLLCAQETGLDRGAFFPITETTADGHTKENIAKLGLSLGDGFVSPTGALFSKQLKIVGRGEPMYDGRREVEEAIYDYFAVSLAEKDLKPAPDLFQSLRLKMAEAAKSNPLLAKALAASAGVNEQMDLVSAAKASAVVETLDSIAYGASGDFVAARRAIIEGNELSDDERQQLTPEEREALQRYRSRHADLAARFDARQLSPAAVRVALVRYYADQGRRQLDQRFFSGGK